MFQTTNQLFNNYLAATWQPLQLLCTVFTLVARLGPVFVFSQPASHSGRFSQPHSGRFSQPASHSGRFSQPHSGRFSQPASHSGRFSQPQRPIQPASQPQRPIQPASQPQRPIQPVSQPQRPIQPASQPQRPMSGRCSQPASHNRGDF